MVHCERMMWSTSNTAIYTLKLPQNRPNLTLIALNITHISHSTMRIRPLRAFVIEMAHYSSFFNGL